MCKLAIDTKIIFFKFGLVNWIFIKNIIFLGLGLIIFFSNFTHSQTRTASGTVTTYSLKLYNISGYHAGSGFWFNVYFSTFDGIANAYPQGLNSNKISGELSPTIIGGSEYRSDYAIYASGYYYNRGFLVMNIPTNDADGNGFPDFLQVNRPIDSSVGFTLYEYETKDGYNFYWYGTETGTIRLSRAAGNYQGSVNGSINTSTFTGNFSAEGGPETLSTIHLQKPFGLKEHRLVLTPLVPVHPHSQE